MQVTTRISLRRSPTNAFDNRTMQKSYQQHNLTCSTTLATTSSSIVAISPPQMLNSYHLLYLSLSCLLFHSNENPIPSSSHLSPSIPPSHCIPPPPLPPPAHLVLFTPAFPLLIRGLHRVFPLLAAYPVLVALLTDMRGMGLL